MDKSLRDLIGTTDSVVPQQSDCFLYKASPPSIPTASKILWKIHLIPLRSIENF